MSTKPKFLFVGTCLDEAGHFKQELHPPQMYLPDIDGISCYIGRKSRVLHIDDILLGIRSKKNQ